MPTLSPDGKARDWIFAWRWQAHAAIARGDIIIFRSPVAPETQVVKRVVAIEGDVVRLRGRPTSGTTGVGMGMSMVGKGTGVGGVGGVRGMGGMGGGGIEGMDMGLGMDLEYELDKAEDELVSVPKGQLWVEGDEAFHSLDSNSYGPVSAPEKIKKIEKKGGARADAIYYY